MLYKFLPVIPAQGGEEVALGLYCIIKILPSIEFACAVRQPGPCVRALCEVVALLLSKNMTCARPRCNATPNEQFLHTSLVHASHPALHTSHSTLHALHPLRCICILQTLHLKSYLIMWALLISALLISPHFFSHVI